MIFCNFQGGGGNSASYAALTLAAALAASSSQAASFWLGTGENFTDRTSWDSNKLPGSDKDNYYVRESRITGTDYARSAILGADAAIADYAVYYQAGTEDDPFVFDLNGKTLSTPAKYLYVGSNVNNDRDESGVVVLKNGNYSTRGLYIGSSDRNTHAAGLLVIDGGATVSSAYDGNIYNGKITVRANGSLLSPSYNMYIGRLSSSLDRQCTVENDGGTIVVKRLLVGGNEADTRAAYVQKSGSLSASEWFCVGMNANAKTSVAYFELDGGTVAVTSASHGFLFGDNGQAGVDAKVVVKGGTLTTAGILSVGRNGPAQMTVEGGEVDVAKTLYFAEQNGCVAGEECLLALKGGKVRTANVAYGAGVNAPAVLTFDGGTLAARSAHSAFIAKNANLSVVVAAGGGTIDAAGFAITIPADFSESSESGESGGGMTFAGGGSVAFTGAAGWTGATAVQLGTTLSLDSAANVASVLAGGLRAASTLTTLDGEYAILTRTDGGSFAASDLASVAAAPGSNPASMEFAVSADGKSIKVAYTAVAGTYAWNGGTEETSWLADGAWLANGAAAAWEDGSMAEFSTAGAKASIAADATALSLSFAADAEISGTGVLTVPEISVADGVSVAISAPTAGAVEKTGAGTLALGSARSSRTVVAGGTLAFAEGATIDPDLLLVGKTAGTPAALDYGGQTLTMAEDRLPYLAPGAGMDETLLSGTYRFTVNSGLNDGNLPEHLTIGKGATMLADQRRFVWNTSTARTIDVKGGKIVSTGAASNSYGNNYIMNSGSGEMTMNFTDGASFEITGLLYAMSAHEGDALQSGASPKLEMNFTDSAFSVAGNGLLLGYYYDRTAGKSADAPRCTLNTLRSTVVAPVGIRLGEDASRNPRNGGKSGGYHAAVFGAGSIVETKFIWVCADRNNSASFDGATVRLAGDTGSNGILVQESDHVERWRKKAFSVRPGGLVIDTNGYPGRLKVEPDGEGAIAKDGDGMLSVDVDMTGAGALEVRGGVLEISAGVAVARPVTVKEGAALKLAGNGSSNNVGSLSLEDGAKLQVVWGSNGYGTLSVQNLSLPSGDGEKALIDVLPVMPLPAVGEAYKLSGFGVDSAALEHLEVSAGYEISAVDGVLAITFMPKTTEWTGLAGDGLWSTAGNWSNGVPSAGDTVVFAPAEGVVQVSTNDLGTLSLAVLRKDGEGTAEIAGLADIKPPLELNGGLLKSAPPAEGEEAAANPLSTASDTVSLAGALDLGGASQQIRVAANPQNVFKDGAEILNGSMAYAASQRWFFFPLGTLTVGPGATLDFGSDNDRNQFNANKTGTTSLVIDGGSVKMATVRTEDNTGHYWGNGDNQGAIGIMEVKNGGLFENKGSHKSNAKRNNFILGRGYGKSGVYGILKGLDSPDAGYRFTGRVCAGARGTGVIAMTNCAFKAANIMLGYIPGVSEWQDGTAEISFAGGSTLTTYGFYGGDSASADIVFDGAKVVIEATPADYIAINQQSDVFGRAKGPTVYTVAEGGLELSSAASITNAITLSGTGSVAISGTGRIAFTADQSYTGSTTVKSGATFAPGGITLSGAFVVEEGATLEVPEIPAGEKSVLVVKAASYSGDGLDLATKDASGNHLYVSATGLRYGLNPGLTVILR